MNLDLTKASEHYSPPCCLTGEQLGRVLEIAETIESYIKQARQEAQDRLALGQQVEGWTLEPTEGKRSIADTVGAQRKLNPLLRLSDFLACCRVSITDLVEAIRKQEQCTIAEAKDIMSAYLKDFFVKGNEDGANKKLVRLPKDAVVKELNPPAL